MKYKFGIIGILIVFTFIEKNSFAQSENKLKIGLGIEFPISEWIDHEYEYWQYPLNSFYIPIDIKSKIRIEPKFGITIIRHEWASNLSPWTFPEFLLEIGILKINSFNKFNLLYGFRGGYTTAVANFTFAPTISGEYFLHERFSLGTEVQTKFYYNFDKFVFLTKTYAVVRYYFKI